MVLQKLSPGEKLVVIRLWIWWGQVLKDCIHYYYEFT